MSSLYKLIPFNVNRGKYGGSLIQLQQGAEPENALPFDIGKVLVSTGMQPGDVRGNHAHYETEEVVVALSGGCIFELDDGCGTRECVRLGVGESGSAGVEASGSKGTPQPGSRKPATGNLDVKDALLLFPHVWRTFRDFESGTILLVVANMKYEESDYIRDRVDFERIAQAWTGLGGSSES